MLLILDFECLECHHRFKTWISCGHLPICKNCHPTVYTFKSREENEVFEYLKTLGLTIEQRNRTLINPFELDLVCHDKRIAIEYCGLYWHSESSNNRLQDYHIKKMNLCKNKGYRLITIFSDEWVQRKSIVMSKLSNIFGVTSLKIAARKCQVSKIDSVTAKEFYNCNHIQGHTNASVHIGLIYKTQLVACMSFNKARIFTNNKQQYGVYELIRYASSATVQGGAGKLLAEFERKYNPKEIFSYADARWSQGNLYLKLGFISATSIQNPGYWYTKDYMTRQHRFNFTKKSLIKQGHNPSLTEWQIMQSMGWDRIWDCGQLKFVKFL